MNFAEIFVGALRLLLVQLAGFIPKLLVALIIWIVGKYFINLGVGFIRKIEVKKVKPVSRLLDSLVFILLPLGKVLLFLIILDYLGIGSSVVQALVSGFTFAIAIAIGLAFGKALEEDARKIVESVRRQLEK
jgi:small conductance mechanosensitive channel